MANNFRQGFYEIKNPQKYVGRGKPKYRSGWEFTFMLFLDNNDHILQWASESVSIPYRNRNNTMRAELIEIKPRKQSLIEEKQSQRDRAQVAINYAKWDAATRWAKQNGLTFRVINEDQIFRQGNKKPNK